MTTNLTSMAIMKAISVKPGGGIGGMFIDDNVAKPVPAPDQCLVRVKAFGLNRADTLQREGGYPPPPGIVDIMGLEMAGVIEEVGSASDDQKWKVGDEVFGLLYGGAYAEYVIINKNMLIAKPKELSWEMCGGLPEVWFTALQALHMIGRYQAGRVKSVLWHAGASAVSIAGIQLALTADACYTGSSEENGYGQHEPLKVFATARTDEKCDMCVRKLGCTAAINTSKDKDWAKALKELNGGQGIDLVFDFVGAPYFQANLDVLAMDGVVVNLGLLGGPMVQAPVNIAPFVMKRARFEGSTLRTRSVGYQVVLKELFEEKVLPNILNGHLKHVVDKALDWKEVETAHWLIETNATKGKVVCSIPWESDYYSMRSE